MKTRKDGPEDSKNIAIPFTERELWSAICRVKEKYSLEALSGHDLSSKLMVELKDVAERNENALSDEEAAKFFSKFHRK